MIGKTNNELGEINNLVSTTPSEYPYYNFTKEKLENKTISTYIEITSSSKQKIIKIENDENSILSWSIAVSSIEKNVLPNSTKEKFNMAESFIKHLFSY